MIIKIPLDLKSQYLQDPENFLRDIAAVSTESVRPFFRRKEKITEAFKIDRLNPFQEADISFHPDFKCEDEFNRYMHIDLGLTRDAAGISMCHAPHFITVDKFLVIQGQPQVQKVMEPYIKFDFVARIKAGRGEEIILSEVRNLIYELTDRGFHIPLITYDGFQSADSIQILRSQGYRVSKLSVDRTSHKIVVTKEKTFDREEGGISRISTEGKYTAAFQVLKDAMYSDRLDIPYHEVLEKEAKTAEINYRKNKVDHPPRGTIDMLQSCAGSAFNLVNNEFETEEFSNEDYVDKFEDKFYNNTDTDRDYLYG